MGCIFIVFIGMIITLEPSIFNMRDNSRGQVIEEANPETWYFYVIYALAWLPLAFGYVLMEKGQKQYDVILFYLLYKVSKFWLHNDVTWWFCVTIQTCP